jgi:hypothetical protein
VVELAVERRLVAAALALQAALSGQARPELLQEERGAGLVAGVAQVARHSSRQGRAFGPDSPPAISQSIR